MKKAFIGIIFVVVLICCLLATEFVFENFAGEFDELEQLKTSLENETDIIYFGDSVVKSPTAGGVEQMLSDVSGKSVKIVAHEAYHLGVYEATVNFISKQEKKPEVIVIPINLRSFSPEWDTRPQYQFQNEITKLDESEDLLIGLWVRVTNLFGNSDEKKLLDDITWKQENVYFGKNIVGRVNEFEFLIHGDEEDIEELVKKKFIYQYGYLLNEKTNKMDSLKNIIKKCKEMNSELVLYITPIDVENGKIHAGEEFLEIIKNNTTLLEKIGIDNGANIIDLSFDLEHEKFEYVFIPNEHLKEEGLQYVAEKISEKLN